MSRAIADDRAPRRTFLLVMPLAEQRGGAELSLLHLAQEDATPEVRWIVVFLTDGPMVQQFRAASIEVHVMEAGRLRQLPRWAAAVWQIVRVIRRARPDLVIGWMGKAQLYAGPAGLLTSTPTICHQLGLPSRRHWLDVAATVLAPRGVVTNSRTSAEAQRRLTPRRPVAVVHPGVELRRFSPGAVPSVTEARAQLGLDEEGPIVGLVGRLQTWKGVHVLLSAMPAIVDAYPRAQCVIVGGRHDLEPDYPDRLAKLVDRLGLRDHTVFAGHQTDVPTWVQAMDVVVHASDNEPFGMVVLEAMALGKPVIAGASGGPTEVIRDGVDGLLVTFGDVAGLSQSILGLLEDPEGAAQLGARALARARTFSSEAFVRNFSQTLVGFLDDPAPSRRTLGQLRSGDRSADDPSD